MGGHEKKEECAGCSGNGGWWTTEDGKKLWIPCATCNGTGKVP